MAAERKGHVQRDSFEGNRPVTVYPKWWPSDPRERSEEPGFQLAAVQTVRPESEGCGPGVPCWHLGEALASGK